MRREKATVKWSKKDKDWKSNYESNAGRGLGHDFFNMITMFERFMEKDWEGKPTGFVNLREHIRESGFDPDTFTISVQKLPPNIKQKEDE